MPACVPFDFCERPPSISHGFMVTSPENIYRIWTEVYYECHQGYQMKGVKSLKVGCLHNISLLIRYDNCKHCNSVIRLDAGPPMIYLNAFAKTLLIPIGPTPTADLCPLSSAW